MSDSGARVILGLAVCVVAAAVAGAFLVIGPPGEQRAVRFDERRVGDLQRIAEAVDVYWTRNAVLPASLEALQELGGVDVPLDPETGEAYGFRVLDGSRYEICAEFNRRSPAPGIALRSPATRPGPGDPFWSHDSGRQCFKMEAEDLGAVDPG